LSGFDRYFPIVAGLQRLGVGRIGDGLAGRLRRVLLVTDGSWRAAIHTGGARLPDSCLADKIWWGESQLLKAKMGKEK
jgi:hypothetical protein